MTWRHLTRRPWDQRLRELIPAVAMHPELRQQEPIQIELWLSQSATKVIIEMRSGAPEVKK